MSGPLAFAGEGEKSGSNAEGEKNQTEKTTENEGDKEEDKKEDLERNTVKTDSSVHSISKYNFLFYMVYKVKYGEVNESTDSKQAIAEE